MISTITNASLSVEVYQRKLPLSLQTPAYLLKYSKCKLICYSLSQIAYIIFTNASLSVEVYEAIIIITYASLSVEVYEAIIIITYANLSFEAYH